MAKVIVYKLVRPKGKGEKFYTSRREGETMGFAIGKLTAIKRGLSLGQDPRTKADYLCTDSVIHAYRSIADIFKHHGAHVGYGAWAVLKCETSGIFADDGSKVGVLDLMPVKELGVFTSGLLREKSRYATISKAKDETGFMAAVKKGGKA